MKKLSLITLLLIVTQLSVFSQDTALYSIAEQMPEFPGGEKALYQFLASNVKYPAEAKDSCVQGKVYLQFIVETDGTISNIIVKRGIGSGCDEEAVRVVQMMPLWKPGEQAGKAVRVKYILPFHFKLDNRDCNKAEKD